MNLCLIIYGKHLQKWQLDNCIGSFILPIIYIN
jgi:hypothetical protein